MPSFVAKFPPKRFILQVYGAESLSIDFPDGAPVEVVDAAAVKMLRRSSAYDEV